MVACEAGSVECVKMLLAHNADVNYETDKCTALTSACKSGNIEIVNLIISRDELSIELVYSAIVSCMISTALCANITIVKVLLSRIPDINRILLDGKTLLNLAAFYGNLAAVRLFLESGADRNAVDSRDEDALYCTTYFGFLYVAETLLDWDSPNQISRESITKAFDAACYHRHIKMVRFLIDHGADVNVRNDGKLAIDHAIRNNNVVLVELLICNGLDINTMYYDRNFYGLHVYSSIERSPSCCSIAVPTSMYTTPAATPFFSNW